MDEMKEILAKYTNQIALRAVEMDEENAAIVLYVLSSALDEGTDAHLANMCHRFYEERMKEMRGGDGGNFSLN